MFATLTGLGLSTAAGLNAYVPLLAVGLIARFTDLIPLSDSWRWIEHPVTLVLLAVLLVVEFVADKVPAVDSVNDVIQTVVRPTSGGITFGAGASTVELSEITGAASGASSSGDGLSWGAVIVGVLVALAFHVVKSLARPVANTMTFGCAGPVISFLEDAASVVTSLLAILVPILILVVFPLLVLWGVWVVRRRGRRKRERAQASSPAGPESGGGRATEEPHRG